MLTELSVTAKLVSNAQLTFSMPVAVNKAQYLTFPDSGDVHGSLLALGELATAFGDDMIAARRKVGQQISHVHLNSAVSSCLCALQLYHLSVYSPSLRAALSGPNYLG